jgi:CPA1 family monovalent cation:H+ antiporter
MQIFEWTIALLVVALALSAVARRVGVPYPTFLALGGVGLAFLPFGPRFELEPQLALALFVAPVLLDAAYDASPRDLRRNIGPLLGLVFGAIFATTAAVAIVARWLVPDMPWAVAITLGAILAPPDASAAVSVLRQVNLPYRARVILEGESLLNDATALLIYRFAIAAATGGAMSYASAVPTFAVIVGGSIAAGFLLGKTSVAVMARMQDAPSAIALQFCGTFGVWLLAERVGLSGVLTIVAYAAAIAQRAPSRTTARMRVSSYAVWELAVFVLNVLAFVIIGLQLRPIVEGLSPAALSTDFRFALVMLATVIVVRIPLVVGADIIVMALTRLRRRPGEPAAPQTWRGALAVSWSGMRGIVTLAAAFALPAGDGGGPAFPHRDLILLTAFVVVLGTLVVQGTTLRPLLAMLHFREDDFVRREVERARSRVYRAALDCLDGDDSPDAEAVRADYYDALLSSDEELSDADRPSGQLGALRQRSLAAARKTLIDLRHSGEISDPAFHVVEEELDRAQINADTASPW